MWSGVVCSYCVGCFQECLFLTWRADFALVRAVGCTALLGRRLLRKSPRWKRWSRGSLEFRACSSALYTGIRASKDLQLSSLVSYANRFNYETNRVPMHGASQRHADSTFWKRAMFWTSWFPACRLRSLAHTGKCHLEVVAAFGEVAVELRGSVHKLR